MNPTTEKLIIAYDKMLERIHHIFDHADDETPPLFKDTVRQAQEKAVELSELSKEEADKIGDYLHRDIQDAAHFLAKTEKELEEWINFDLELVESNIQRWFSGVADQTRVEINKLSSMAELSGHYKVGEVTGPGTLYCGSCDKKMPFKKTGYIPPCPECKNDQFRRA